MNEWIPAIYSMAGLAGLMLQGLVGWIGTKIGWIDPDDSVGTFGCAWAIACMAMILTGFLLWLKA